MGAAGFKVTTRKTTYALTYVSISIALHATRPCCGRGSLHGTPATCGYRGNCGNFIRGLTSTTVPIVDSTNLKYPLTNIPWSKTRISAHQRQLMNDDLTGRRAPTMHLTIDPFLIFSHQTYRAFESARLVLSHDAPASDCLDSPLPHGGHLGPMATNLPL
jgi:hypothetical protein